MDSLLKLSLPSTCAFWELPILFEDEYLLALDKPADLLTSPEAGQPDRPSLLELLHSGINSGKSWASKRGLTYLMNAQRLDDAATGVLLFAKAKPVLTALLNTFSTEKFAREYLVLVHKGPQTESGEIEAKLTPDRARPGFERVDHQRGKRSRTRFEVVERFSKFTLLRCTPYPDRAHQVRVHMRHAGFPVVGDSPYRGQPLLLSRLKPDYHLKPGRQENPLISRAALHCEKLTVPHPVNGEPFHVSAPVPKDFIVGLKYLRRFDHGSIPSE